MQEKSYGLMKHIIWAAAVVSCVTIGSISIARYLSKKSDYETRAQRVQAVEELMSSEGFQDYTQKRKELVDKMHEGTEDIRTGHVTSVVESTLGKFEFKEFVKENK